MSFPLESEEHEAKIKCLLLDVLLAESDIPNDCFITALEVAFSGGRRRADLVSIGNEVIGYEIKGKRDNLEGISEQISEYQKVFDKTYVVVDIVHLKNIRSKIPNSVGIWKLENGKLSHVRKAVRIKRLSKPAILASVSRSTLNGMFRSAGRTKAAQTDYSELIIKLTNHYTTTIIREHFRTELHDKYKNSFNEFLNERGSVTLIDDLKILSRSRSSAELS